ncbi:hypothetical protein M501DRAFT_1010161 [Patellaria atrata CBS 101060]|uniref:Maintenance of telomere capping protein 1 n=1 Tax=Patellaria atrata CBS 101060 TaxID=1346257 RepID=A0A9P4VRI9_9PEZI|nr:hypothetical protein M501DRAFT_1010161 [Patellaria atrata CBS 101060]
MALGPLHHPSNHTTNSGMPSDRASGSDLTALVPRPNTPKVSSSSTTTSRTRSPKRGGVVTPSSTGSARTSEDKTSYSASVPPRKSGESSRSFHQPFTPADESDQKILQAPPAPEPQKQASSGGWWGSILSTATTAVKQAEAAVKEIQKNEEAQKWAEQMRGNVGALRGIGTDLTSRALPTFTNLIHHLAPPISQHERLQIHLTHDLLNYPSLDPLVYTTFSRVMSQVEGGDLLVIQRGSESTARPTSSSGSSLGWNDGPWWRDTSAPRSLNLISGLPEGTKLSRASAEGYANDFFNARGGIEAAAKAATEILDEANPVRRSDIFLAVQALSYTQPDLFSSSDSNSNPDNSQDPDGSLVAFAISLTDPIHSLHFHTLSQPFPAKWARWLDSAPSPDDESSDGALPEEIYRIVEQGGVDPREWVAEWVEEVLGLAVGVVAQRYVAKRMGVGEGQLGRGRGREEVVESGAGEAARAGAI